MRTLVKMEFGSAVYGTRTKDSDTDYKEIFIPDARDILLQRTKNAIHENTKPSDATKNTKDDVDIERFALHKYIGLLAEGQTVAVDMLFVPVKHLVYRSGWWEELQWAKDKVLHKDCTSFVGYCLTQASKYGIRGSRISALRGILELLKEKPLWSKLGEHSDILEFSQTTEHCSIIPKKDPNSVSQNDLINICGYKLSLKDNCKRAIELYDRKFQEYGERSRLAELNLGIDWKALMHSIRILTQAEELLLTGNITFPRPNSKFLLEVRTGQKPYKEVAEMIENGIENLQQNILPKSMLREKVDQVWVDNFVCEIYKETIENETFS